MDGTILNVTDFSKCLMPPPMSMLKYPFESNIVGFSKSKNNIVVVTEQKVHLIDLVQNKTVVGL